MLRTVDPAPAAFEGREVSGLSTIGKRIVLEFDNGFRLVLHLMIAGRLHWKSPHAKLTGRQNLAALDFDDGTLLLSEAGSKRRASLHLFASEAEMRKVDPGGADLFSLDLARFRSLLSAENQTIKNALTDPRILSGIGNAYSDEILHAARLSPLRMTQKLTGEEWERLFESSRATLRLWIDRLRAEARNSFPEKVTAFRKEMAVKGRYGKPCPVCGNPVQRIRYADNETNYCAECQNGGKLLADRGMSRLLGKDRPKTLEDLEVRRIQKGRS